MIRTETDIQECENLWDVISPKQNTWDDWDLIFAFHDQDKHRLNFLVHENSEGKPDGMIPLVYDTQEERHMLMGGSYPDGRSLWLQHKDFPEFFEQFPERTALFELSQRWVDELLQRHPQFEANFAEQDHRYYLVPEEIDFDFHNHIDSFSSEKKQSFLYDLRNIRKREPVLHWSTRDESELFIDLVNKNFGANSDYANDDGANEVRRVTNELERSGRLKTLTIDIDGAKQAVAMSSLHNNKMVALYASSNKDYNNLGKLLNVENIQEACRMRVDEISFMTGMKWKADWKMKSEPCRTMRKPVGPWAAVPG